MVYFGAIQNLHIFYLAHVAVVITIYDQKKYLREKKDKLKNL